MTHLPKAPSKPVFHKPTQIRTKAVSSCLVLPKRAQGREQGVKQGHSWGKKTELYQRYLESNWFPMLYRPSQFQREAWVCIGKALETALNYGQERVNWSWVRGNGCPG